MSYNITLFSPAASQQSASRTFIKEEFALNAISYIVTHIGDLESAKTI